MIHVLFLRCTVATGNIYEENVDQSDQCVRQGENEGLEEISNNFEGRIDGSDEEIDDETTSFSEEEELLFRRRLEEGYDLFDARYQAWLELNSTVYDTERLLNNGPSGTLMSSSSSMSLSGPPTSSPCPPMNVSGLLTSSPSGPPIVQLVLQ